MTVHWRLIASAADGWAQWCDLGLADRWIAEAVRLTRSERFRALSAAPYAEQVAAARDAWRALSYAYRALNCPPLSDPWYAQLWLAWYGPTANVDAAVSQAGRVDRVVFGATPGRPGVVPQRIVSWWRELGQALTPLDDLCNGIVRLSLTYPHGELVTQCTGMRDGDAEAWCNFGGIETGCGNWQTRDRQGCDPWTWDAMAWHTPPRGGPGGAVSCLFAKVLPPLRWCLELAQGIADALAERRALGVLSDVRLSVAARNARTARELGVLPAELLELAVQTPTDLAAMRSNNPDFRRTSRALMLAGAAAAAVPGGQIAGAIVAGVGEAVSLLPAAYGFDADRWGRARPVWERGTIVGDAGPDGAPRYDVPDPPGAPAGRAPLPALVSLPALDLAAQGGVLTTTAGRPPGAELTETLEGRLARARDDAQLAGALAAQSAGGPSEEPPPGSAGRWLVPAAVGGGLLLVVGLALHSRA